MNPNDVKRTQAFALQQHLLAGWAELVHAHERLHVLNADPFGPSLTSVLMLRHVIVALRTASTVLEDPELESELNALDLRHPAWKDLRDMLTHVEDYTVGSGHLQKKSDVTDPLARLFGFAFFKLAIVNGRASIWIGGGTTYTNMGNVSHERFQVGITEACTDLWPLVEKTSTALRATD